jgi:hypothetical protein
MYLAKAKTEYLASNSRFVGVRKKDEKIELKWEESGV